ncbi:MAG: SurA N-terminal domain-containing protein [Gammaproteobacteria bacterium]|nr:SurA N-terminal domain-containing protein [Gammaproteobacteria bacterium]
MLEYIRERAQGWFAWIIIGMLIIPFALWGINSYFDGGSATVVANVNGTDISLREYDDLRQQQRERVRSMLGASANAELIESLVKPHDILDGVIERELLTQAAKKAGYRAGDALLAEQIKGEEGFQRDGQFSKQIYEQYVRSQGLTPASFEARMARSLVLGQLNSGVLDSALVSKKDVEAYIRLRDQKRDLGYMLIPVAQFEATATAADDKIKDYFEHNRDRFVQPEEVSVEYVEIQSADLLAKVGVTEAELKQYYEEQKDQFGVGEERRTRHILIAADKTKDPSGDKGLARAQELLTRVKKGESFEELAKKNSEDPGSASSGGDLGFLSHDQMDKAFAEAAFALKKGELSAPVKSSYGYHLIKVEDIRAGSQKSFEQVRGDIEQRVKNKKADALFFERSETLATLAYEKPDSLQPVADQLGLKIQTTGFFGKRGGPGIASNPKLAAAAFKDDVIKKGLNSEPVEVGPNHIVVLRMKEHKPEAQRSLEEVRPQVVAAVKHEFATQKAEEVGKSALKRIDAGEDPQVVAKELKVEWKIATAGRNEAALDRSLVEHVFKLVRPDTGKATGSGLHIGNGDYAVVRLVAVKDGDPSQIDDTQKKSIIKTLAEGAAETEFSALLESVKKSAKIARYENKL